MVWRWLKATEIPTFPGQIMVNTWRDWHTAPMVIAPHTDHSAACSDNGFTYLLIPWCRVFLEKLTGLQLVKKFPAFHRTWRFITALTSVRHLSLSWASPIQSIYPHPTYWRFILILSAHLHLGLPSGSFPPVSPPRPYTPLSPHPHTLHAQPISFFSNLSPAQCWVRNTDLLAPRDAISSIPPLPRHSSVQIFFSTPYSQTPSASFPPAMSVTKFHTHTKQQAKL